MPVFNLMPPILGVRECLHMVRVCFVNAAMWPSGLSVVTDGEYGGGGAITMALNKLGRSGIGQLLPAGHLLPI